MPNLFGCRTFRVARTHKKKDKYTKKRPPVKKGQTLTVYIEDMSKKGDGVAKVEGFTVFVPGAKEGELAKVKIIEVKKNCAVGKKIKC